MGVMLAPPILRSIPLACLLALPSLACVADGKGSGAAEGTGASEGPDGPMALMLEEIEKRTMPPWAAQKTERCVPEHDFEDDPSLTTEEIALCAAWLANGSPEGDPCQALALPEPPNTELVGVSGTF